MRPSKTQQRRLTFSIIMRSLIFQGFLYAWLTLVLLVMCPTLLFPGRKQAIITIQLIQKGSFFLTQWIGGITYEVRGLENLVSPSIIASKHQSTWDTIIFLAALNDGTYVLKKELTKIPIYGQFITRYGMISVDRSQGMKAIKSLVTQSGKIISQGRSIVLFPEGTRVPPGTHRPYQRGVATLYASLNVPVIPVALNSGLFWPRRSIWKYPGVITIEFLPAIHPGLDRQHFMTELTNKIETASNQLLENHNFDKGGSYEI